MGLKDQLLTQSRESVLTENTRNVPMRKPETINGSQDSNKLVFLYT